MDGLLIIDKPEGITSHDVVTRVRRILRTKRVGHTGTLDPFATGAMVILVGNATRLARFVDKDEKEYEAALRFGFGTDTGDLSGSRTGDPGLRAEEISEKIISTDWDDVFDRFRGDILQTPPMYSAKKVGGKKLYEFARAGKEVERKSVPVSIHKLELLARGFHSPPYEGGEIVLSTPVNSDSTQRTPENNPAREAPLLRTEGSKPDSPPISGGAAAGMTSSDQEAGYQAVAPLDVIRIRVTCSAGTYIRTLAEDIGREIGVSAHLVELRRTRSGKFTVDDAVTLSELEDMTDPSSRLRPLTEAVSHLPAVTLPDERVEKTKNGLASRVGDDGLTDGIPLRMLDTEANLIAIGVYAAVEKSVKPKIVLV